MTASYRYPVPVLAADYARATVGAVLFLGALASLEPVAAVGAFLAAGGALFLVYFARTVCRQLTRIELDEAGIRASGPLGASIRWADLRALKLDFYSTRRDREGGWMQLRLFGARRTIRVDSGLTGFAELARAAAARAGAAGLELDGPTRANLELLDA